MMNVMDMSRRTGRTAREPLLSYRWFLLLASIVYAGVLAYAHAQYLYPYWAYYGFTYRPVGLPEVALTIGLIAFAVQTMPRGVDRPSAVILILLYTIVFVPCIVISLGLNVDRIQRYGPGLAAMAASFAFAGFLTRRGPSRSSVDGALPSSRFVWVMVAAWLVATLILLITYGSVMAFAGVDDIYQQRAATFEESTAIAYLRTYYLSVLSPAVLALGLIRKNALLIVMGIAGCVITYMIDAQKTALLLPVTMVAAYFPLRRDRAVSSLAALTLVALSLLLMTLVTFVSSPIAEFFNSFLLVRTIAIPGLTFSQYNDLFGSLGYTWWSNVSGLDLVLPPPPAFANHPYWPALGRIVGDYYYGFGVQNANANPFSGEGVAAGGFIGTIVIGLVISAWLRLIDIISSGWNRLFVLLIVVPVGVALTNGHFSTTMLSFGGAFWTAVLFFYKPAGNSSVVPRKRNPRVIL